MRYLLFFGFTLVFSVFTACTPGGGKEKLPIIGRQEVVTKTVNGQEVQDTVYHTIADFSFVNQDSATVTHETFAGKIYVADFFFTTCPSICPIMKTQMLRVYQRFEGNPNVMFLSHTVDPEIDTVPVLRNEANGMGISSDRWHLVTGDRRKIYDHGQSSYMVTSMEDKTAPGGVLHSGKFILVDKERRIRGTYNGTETESVDDLIRDMKILLAEYETE